MERRVIESGPAAEAALAEACRAARVALPEGTGSAHAHRLRAAVTRLDAAFAGVRGGPDGLAVGVGAGGMPLREDGGPPVAMARPLDFVAPRTRLGFVLVPRLAVALQLSAGERPDPAVADDAFGAELALGA